jgi:hypothetical protein
MPSDPNLSNLVHSMQSRRLKTDPTDALLFNAPAGRAPLPLPFGDVFKAPPTATFNAFNQHRAACRRYPISISPRFSIGPRFVVARQSSIARRSLLLFRFVARRSVFIATSCGRGSS